MQILFFRKEIYFFEYLYFSECTRISVHIALVEQGAINYVRRQQAIGGEWEGGVIQNAYSYVSNKRRCHASCVRMHLQYIIFWAAFLSIVSCFICRDLTLPLLKKGVFVKNGCFSLIRSISVVIE